MKVGFGPKTIRNGKGLPAEVSIDLARSVTRKPMRLSILRMPFIIYFLLLSDLC